MDENVEVDAGAGTLLAGAGATCAAITAAAAAAGLAVPGLPPGDMAIGAAVARGLVPRRALCSVAAVLPDGERVPLASRVPKDVTGYDLAGLLLGSEERLATVTEVLLRLVPQASAAALPRAEPPGATGHGELADLVREAFHTTGTETG